MDAIEAGGARIPVIGFGTVGLRGPDGVRLVSGALQHGYRHVDTAQNYDSEGEVGEGIAASGVRREDIFITTKVAPPNFAPADFARTTRESLVKLKVAHVDLLLLHWAPPQPFTLADTIGALCRAKRDGLTRHIGVSNFNIALMEEAKALATEPLVCNQIEIHPYLDQRRTIAACRRLGYAVVAHCPIARGRIFGDPVIERIAKAHGRTPSQVALRWLKQQDIVIIPRSSKIERVKENFDVFGFTLTPQEMAEIGGLARPDGRIINDARWAKTWPHPWAPVWDEP